MLLAQARTEIVRHARRLRPDRLAVGSTGSLSVRVGDIVAATPSGVPHEALTPRLVGLYRLDGSQVDARLSDDRELHFHLAAYRGTDAAAVVHTHSAAATAAACLDGLSQLPPVHDSAALFAGPVRIAPYASPGSAGLVAGVEAALAGGRRGCLLANHGALTVADTLPTAYRLAQQLEWLCDVYLRTRAAGLPRALDAEQLANAVQELAGYEQQASRG